MLLLSHICSNNGLVLPIEKIAKALNGKNITIVIDGAHVPGSSELNFKTLADIEFYGGNLHKWMMGPQGIVFGWINPKSREKITPIIAGWNSINTPSHFLDFGDGDQFTLIYSLKGTVDYAPFLAISDLIDFWIQNNSSIIRKRVFDLQRYLENEISRKLDCKMLSPAFGKMRGPFIAYQLPEKLENMGF